MKLFNRIVGFLIITVVVLWSLVWLLSPLVARSVLSDVFTQQQLVLDEKSSVRVNLFRSAVSISDLSWRKDDSTVFRLDYLEVKYSLFGLLASELRIDHLLIDGIEAHVIKQGETITVLGFSPASETPAEEVVEDTEASAPPELPYPLIIPNITLRDISVHADVDGQQQHLLLDELKVNDIEFEAGKFAAGIHIELAVNKDLDVDKPIDGDIPNVVAGLEFDVDIQGELVGAAGIEATLSDFAFGLKDVAFQDGVNKAVLGSLSMSSEKMTFKSLEEGMMFGSALSIEVSDLAASLVENNATLAGFESLSLPVVNIGLDGSNVKLDIDSIVLSALEVSKPAESSDADNALPALALLNAFNIEQLSVEQNLETQEGAVSISSIGFDGLNAEVMLGKNGVLRNLVFVQEEIDPESTNPVNAVTTDAEENENDTTADTEVTGGDVEVAETGSPELAIKIDRIEFTSPANIHVNDASLNPQFDKHFVIKTLLLTDIDNSDLEKFVNFQLEMSDSEYFKYTFNAKAQPFKEKLNVQLDYDASEFSVHEVSPFIETALGFGIKAGQLDSSSSAKIVDDILDGEVKINLRGAKFSSGNNQQEDELDVVGQAAIPINVALNMLKDKKGNIVLTIPISGDVNDPSFGVQYILGLVVKKAVMSQTKKHLINTFVPYGQVLSVAYSAGSYALKVRFEDLVFEPGQTALDDAQNEYVQQFVDLMKKKEKLQVRVCSVATPADLSLAHDVALDDAQRTQLLALSKSRAASFKKKATSLGIDSARLLICAPEVDKGKKAKPSLNISI